MRLHLIAFACVLLAVACSSKPSTEGTTTPGNGSGSGSVGNTGGEDPPAGEYVCTDDSDCVVSCVVAEQCCDKLCPPCDGAFHKDELAAIEAWRDESSCDEADCPMAKCMAPTQEGVARCVEGACTVEMVPYTPE